jgi:hypothetical protein
MGKDAADHRSRDTSRTPGRRSGNAGRKRKGRHRSIPRNRGRHRNWSIRCRSRSIRCRSNYCYKRSRRPSSRDRSNPRSHNPARYRPSGFCFDFSASGITSIDFAIVEFLAAYSTRALLWSSKTVSSTAFRVSTESHSGLASQPLRKIRKGPNNYRSLAEKRHRNLTCPAW